MKKLEGTKQYIKDLQVDLVKIIYKVEADAFLIKKECGVRHYYDKESKFYKGLFISYVEADIMLRELERMEEAVKWIDLDYFQKQQHLCLLTIHDFKEKLEDYQEIKDMFITTLDSIESRIGLIKDEYCIRTGNYY